jgi:hypothetical protein
MKISSLLSIDVFEYFLNRLGLQLILLVVLAGQVGYWPGEELVQILVVQSVVVDLTSLFI